MSTRYPENKSTKAAENKPILAFPVAKFFLYGFLVSITVLFISLTAAYLLSKPTWQWTVFRFPKAFFWSTIVLALSSYTMYKSKKSFERSNALEFVKMLQYTFGLSAAFVIGQLIGWYSLYAKGIYLAGKPDGSYLYLISGLHVLHVLVGLWVLLSFYRQAKSLLNKEQPERLLFFLDPSKEITLDMINTYWHFIDLLWAYLLLFFIFNHL